MQWLPYILGAVVVLFIFLQLRVVVASRRLQGRPAPDFASTLRPEQMGFDRYLIYFYSPHCGPCRRMGPRVDELAGRHPNVLKVDISAELTLARAFGVMATPTAVLVRDGAISRVLLGETSAHKLEALLE